MEILTINDSLQRKLNKSRSFEKKKLISENQPKNSFILWNISILLILEIYFQKDILPWKHLKIHSALSKTRMNLFQMKIYDYSQLLFSKFIHRKHIKYMQSRHKVSFVASITEINREIVFGS